MWDAFYRSIGRTAVVLGLGLASASAATIDSFRYPDAKAAGAAWRAVAGSPAAQAAADGVVFRCPFDTGVDRVYWDRDIALDLSPYTTFELEVTCDRPSALRSLAVYFRSGDGWYVWNKPLREAGHQTVIMHKEDFSSEGGPAGWRRVDRIRISPWKGAPEETRLVAHSLTARRDELFVVGATLSAPEAGDRALSARIAQRISVWLRNVGVRHAIISEQDLLDSGLAGARVAILPYNPQPPASMLKTLRSFLSRGGKLIVCYSASDDLAALMGVSLGDYLQSKNPGRWNAMVFDDADAWHVPPRVYQQSWNIRTVKALSGRGQAIAHWEDAAGRSRGEPAWVATDRGLWMTHVLLDDDRADKERMLLGLIGHFDPGVWPDAAAYAVAAAGKVDNFPDFASAVSGIRAMAAKDDQRDAVEARLKSAQAAREDMAQQQAAGSFIAAIASADRARTMLTEAYSLAQDAPPGEFRGVWDHDAVGWYPGDWDRTCHELHEAGVNAIFPNVLWAGLAHYPSKIVPGSDTLRQFGDQMKACLAAARRYGMKVHAWKVCWQVDNAPDDLVARLRKEGRLQQTADGKTINWMNPALPANRKQELDAIEELARNYDVDGIHLDYIRFPSGDACYAPATQRAFGAWLGKALGPWPSSVRGGSLQTSFKRWRASVITDFVREAQKRVKAVRPDIQLSAAVWGNYPDVIHSIGQDWGAWLREGYVDFVCPMNYTEDAFRFSALVQKQLQLPGSRGRVYPGIGVTSSESQLRPDEVVEQIAALRRLGAKGFMLFDLSQTLRTDVLPVLSQGTTVDAP